MAAISVQEDGGGDYTTLEAAVENASTVDGDVITISGTWSSRENTRIAVADALTIVASGDSKQIGRPWRTGDTHYQHRSTSAGHSFTITDTGVVTFEDLDIILDHTGVSDEIFRNDVSNTFTAKRCLLGFGVRTDQQDVYYNEAVSTALFEQCHFYNVYRSVCDIFAYDTGSTIKLNSCTGYDLGYSTSGSSRSGVVGMTGSTNTLVVDMFNCIFEINTGSVISGKTTASTVNCYTVVTNASSIIDTGVLGTDTDNTVSATINDTDSSGNYILIDTTTSPYDLRLFDNATNNAAQDHSTNATGVGLTIPSTDIVGTSRPQNTNYDIGAFEIVFASTTSTLTGTITATVDEDDITTGGKTLIITITGDTWKAAGTGPIGSTADTQALIDGFSASSSPTNGWNNEVRDKAATTEIVRTSATVATWTVAAQAGYDITAQETITGTIPTAALTTGAGTIVSTPTFTIDPVGGASLLLLNRSIANYGGIRQ